MRKELKQNVKRFLYFVVFHTGLLSLVIALAKRIRKRHPVLILFYHRFSQTKTDGRLLPVLEVAEFEKQMSYLRRTYSIVSMDELVPILATGKGANKPTVVITIDDGYRDNYLFAYPILKRYEIPATIYLASGMINTDRRLWVDDIEFALMNARVKSFRFADMVGGESIEITSLQGKKRAGKHIFTALLKKNNSERKEFMERVVNILDVDTRCLENRSRVMLDLEEISEMAVNGISFGAHTLTHPFLPALASDEAKHEIAFSRNLIERWTKKPVKHFAIPNGQRDDFTDELQSYCDEIGFDTVVTTEAGIVDSSANRLALKRALPSGPLYYFACEVARYLLFTRTFQGRIADTHPLNHKR